MGGFPVESIHAADFEPLSGLDSMYFAYEEDHVLQGVMGVAVCDASTMPRPFTPDMIRDHVLRRLGPLPFLHRVFVPTPLGRGMWQHVKDVDVNYHYQAVPLDGPLTDQALGAFLAEFSATPIDRNRPMWECRVVHGTDNRFAMVLRIHHSTLDGILGMQAAALLYDQGPIPDDLDDEPALHSTVQRARTRHVGDIRAEARRQSWAAKRRAIRALPSLIRDMSTAAAARKEIRANAPDHVKAPHAGGPTSWTRKPATGQFDVSLSTLEVAEVKAAKDALGLKFNDLIYALCAGALRQRLLDDGITPTGPLIVGCPVSTRTPDEFLRGGNQVGDFHAALPVHIADPLERARLTAEALSYSKSIFYAGDPKLQARMLDFLPVRTSNLMARAYTRLKLARWHAPVFDAFITSLPFPSGFDYLCGAKIERIYAVSALNQMCHWDLAAISRDDKVTLSLITDRVNFPNGQAVVDGLESELHRILEAANTVDLTDDRTERAGVTAPTGTEGSSA